MISRKTSTSSALALSFHSTSASSMPKIFSPEIDQLSFLEIIHQTFRRILELGFVRGVLSSLLILGCLVCALICVLCALAALLGRNDFTKQPDEEHGHYSDKDDIPQRPENLHRFRPQTQTRLSRYILSSPTSSSTSPVTKITIHASSVRRSRTSSSSSPSASPTSPSTPLRSALSKSPPSRLSTAQSFLFSRKRRPSPSSSLKSVRWADEIQVSVFTTVEMTVNADSDTDEFDIGTVSPSPTSRYSTNSSAAECQL